MPYVLIGAILIVVVKHFMLDSQILFYDEIQGALAPDAPAPQVEELAVPEVDIEPEVMIDPALYPATDEPRRKFSFFWQESKPVPAPDKEKNSEPEKIEQLPEKQKYATPNVSGKKPKIAIIIDDVGMSGKYTRAVIYDLPPAVTLAILPYAPNVRDVAAKAKAEGHELMIHVPMQATRKMDLGPNGLRTTMDRAAVTNSLEQSFAAFDGYVGINNHMGSKMTQDSKRMGWIMYELKKRGLFFVDSKTIQSSVAADVASRFGIPYAERHVFLDHHEDRAAVDKSLRQLERYARKNGAAIAIGHPKKNTVEALKAWVENAEQRGFELVPVSELLLYPEEYRAAKEAEEANIVPLSHKPDFSLDLLMYKPEEDGELVPSATGLNATNSIDPAPVQ